MTCGCIDNKNLNNKVINQLKLINNNLINNKILKLEDMSNMSIDEIIDLYREGYIIETMQYSTYCTGSTVIDRQNTNAPNDYNFFLSDALAMKVKPTSKCLKDIILHLAWHDTSPNDIYVEIRRNNTSTNLPDGNPQSGGDIGHYVIPYATINPYQYPNFGDITVPLNILLSDTDISNGIWIVICLNFYDPTSADTMHYLVTKTGVQTSNTNEFMAFKSAALPWQGNTSWNIWFKTEKQTYTVPCPIPAVSIACPSSITKGTSGDIVATITFAGTSPYTYKLYRDTETTPIDTSSSTSNISYTFTHTFNEIEGNHTFKVDVIDSCPTGAKTVSSNICTITVSAPTPVLTTIEVSPSTKTLSPGGIQTFTAICKDQSGGTMTCPSITWSVDNTSIGTITQTGVFTAGSTAGNTIVRATGGTKFGTATVTVSAPTPVLTTIEVSPSSKTLSPGSIQTFTAICKDQNGTTMTCPSITWSADNTSIGTITQTGVFTAGSTAGNTTVRATSGTKFGTAAVTVTTTIPALDTITISPTTAYVIPGGTKTFTATPKDQFGGVMTGITITWSVIDTTKGTVSPTTGLSTTFTGATEGTTTIKAASGDIFGAATIAVTTAPPTAGGGMIFIAAVIGLALAYFAMKRSSVSPTEKK